MRLFECSQLPGLRILGNMMEEVSVMMAYDAQVMNQMSEEEILACLVAETGPKFTVRLAAAWMHSITHLLYSCF